MDSKIKRVAYTGYAAKGFVYAMTGILAFLTAFNLGGQKAGKLQIIDFLEKQPFGKVILALLGLGLVCYAIWRFIESIRDPEGIGSDGKGVVKRVSFFISGLVYLGLGVFAIVDIFSEPSKSGGNSLLAGETGRYIFLAVGICLAIKSVYQFVKAYKGDFLKQFNLSTMADPKKRTALKNLGYAGHVARGIVVGIVAYFFIKAGIRSGGSSGEVKGTAEAFSFLQGSTAGPWLLGVVALGLVCYGIYMFAKAKYRTFNTSG
jgi:hypothetical protein